MIITDEQWKQAKEYFDTISNSYNELIGKPGVSVNYTIDYVLNPLLKRYYKGERTEELYHEMMNVE